MYLSHYHLQYKPFQITTDPRFLWLGEKHEEALATLRYAILDNKGFLLLTGDVGTGKTTLINTLLGTLREDTLVASIRDPALEPIDFYTYIAHAFGLEKNFTSKGTFLIRFEQFLHNANRQNKRVLLIIDEAQRISQELLEEVRLLSNIEKVDDKLLNIFFVGQIEFNKILLQPENRPIRQRITANYNISPLTREETNKYIHHRLKIAGSGEIIFEKDSLNEIFSFSRGYPRLINIICDRSLLTGFVEESSTVTLKHVQECAKELEISELTTGNNIIEGITARYEEDYYEPPPKSVPTVPESPAAKEQQIEHTRNIGRNIILTVFVLFLLALSYFVFSKHGVQIPQVQTLMEYVRGFTQPADETAVKEPKSTISDKKTAQPRPEPALKSDQKRTNQEKTETSRTSSLGNEVMDSGKNSAPQKNTTATVKISALQQAKGTDSPKEIIKKMEPVAPQARPEKPQVNVEKLVIPFPTNSNFPSLSSLGKLNILAELLISNPQYKIFVTGFTDSRGNETFNVKLSEFRANAIKSYLVGRGVEESKIITQGSGSQNPIATNTTFSGRMANRRVEIEIYR
jgi:general secretion pathway protein A